MKQPLRRLPLTLATCSALVACSSGGREPNAAAPAPVPAPAQSVQTSAATTTSTTPCNVPVLRGADVSSWQLVTLKSFTYCVPPDWRGSGGSWRAGRTTLNAGTGTPRRQRVAVTQRVVVRQGERPMPLDQPPGSDVRQFEEVIGGNSATLYRNRFDATYYVGATWKTPPVWITAETPDTDAADLVLQIARTVRFVQK